MKYKTIYADPPWMEHGGGRIPRGADRHYPLMKTKDIAALPGCDLADPDDVICTYGRRIISCLTRTSR